jgi:hypothetical protein
MTFGYSVSLQVRHPNADPAKIRSTMALPCFRSWAVGEQRSTPKGELLHGTYDHSYCAFEIGEGDDGKLADLLRQALKSLQPYEAFLTEIRRTGGKINFYSGWSRGDTGEIFDVTLLAEMARIGIDPGIELVVSE